MQYFLAKSEPNTYSIDDLAKDKTTVWDGVHSFAALRYIKEMKRGDKILFYNSGTNPGIVGLAEVISLPRKNEKDTRESFVVDVKFLSKFIAPVTLKEIKDTKKFSDFALIRQSRLSTMSVPEEFITWLKKEKKISL